MKKSLIYFCRLGLAVILLTGCKKKLDFEYDNRLSKEPIAGSITRIVNITGSDQLRINNTKLTAFIAPAIDGSYGEKETRGTIYFPENGRIGVGTAFTVPQMFVGADGQINNIQFSSLGNRQALPPSRSFVAKNDPNNATDYYYVRYRPNRESYLDSLIAVPRSISPSSNPASFRIRLVNLSSDADRNSLPGMFRKGAMTLAFADGTPLAGMAAVEPGKYSEYIDVPYGTYQFKVLDSDGKEVPSSSSYVMNPQTGTLMDLYGEPGIGGKMDTWLTYAPIRSYQPGGVYTIVVSMNTDCSIPTGNPNGETYNAEGNTFRIIADIADPVNMTYARMQAVAAIPGTTVQWKTGNGNLGKPIGFAEATAYQSFITGVQSVKAYDNNGKLLAEKELKLEPGDNITAWLFTAADGKPAISFVANNLSGKFFNGKAGEDGSYSMYKDGFPTWMRLMNFCPQLNEVSFRADNGQQFIVGAGSKAASATDHILLGKPVVSDAYVQFMLNHPARVLAYASAPGILPGNFMTHVAPLENRRFIARPDLYKTASLPNKEPGVYTVAIVGETVAAARMIIVKHNQ
ncbi:hypothetical protein HHL16_22105 [Pseudoflavitalea sp. G-6-1-2]|uniref:hypothetical protein n=1 Tax=Pseudoflavitalea sp. G-6-1-2 TaxID=2728841 RepID=UPI00146AA882|nr:hypothetical protein [Pseudoflavitalea sp. G-6-1-2]NML23589.1 hypothetical protein [Pseudoflavitalea sp. G-6-1-2]